MSPQVSPTPLREEPGQLGRLVESAREVRGWSEAERSAARVRLLARVDRRPVVRVAAGFGLATACLVALVAVGRLRRPAETHPEGMLGPVEALGGSDVPRRLEKGRLLLHATAAHPVRIQTPQLSSVEAVSARFEVAAEQTLVKVFEGEVRVFSDARDRPIVLRAGESLNVGDSRLAAGSGHPSEPHRASTSSPVPAPAPRLPVPPVAGGAEPAAQGTPVPSRAASRTRVAAGSERAAQNVPALTPAARVSVRSELAAQNVPALTPAAPVTVRSELAAQNVSTLSPAPPVAAGSAMAPPNAPARSPARLVAAGSELALQPARAFAPQNVPGFAPAATVATGSELAAQNALYGLAIQEHHAHRLDAARERLETYLARYLAGVFAPDARMLSGQIFLAQERWSQARTAFALAARLAPTAELRRQALYQEGVACQRAGDAAAAQALFDEAVKGGTP